MRIISGSHKGKPIKPNKRVDARPTTDFAKESLFNILANNFNFEAVNVLDLFSGTGSISYEFASRGCPDITSVEINFGNYNFIRNTATSLKFEQIKAIRANVFPYIKFCKTSYDIIFADPPFDMKDFEKIPELIFNYKLIKAGGFLIMEHSKNTDFSKHPHFFENRRYGSVNFSFLKS